jgi:hypothetical protein
MDNLVSVTDAPLFWLRAANKLARKSGQKCRRTMAIATLANQDSKV